MDDLQRLKEKLAKRARVFMPVLSPEGASYAAAFAAAGIDCMLIDAEHAPIGMETLRSVLAACRKAGLCSVVRVQDAEYAFISKALDAGADGLMIPRVESLAQVETAVLSSKFPPVGKKGCGGPGIFRPGETVADFNENRVLFLQIESPQGIDTLPEILARFGRHIDGIIVGPTDLSISLGIPMEFDNPLLHSEIQRLIQICQKEKKSCGMYMDGWQTAAFWARRGMNILWVADDHAMAAAGAKALVKVAEEMDVHG